MDRLNLTSAESRARIKNYLNERYRSLATSCGLGQVRRGPISFNTANGTQSYSPAGLIKPLTLVYAAENRVLTERTQDELLMLDPDSSTTGSPEMFAVLNYGATTCTIRLWPTPNAIYAISGDGIVTGTDMSADGDIPAFPEDFHDILIFMASADELTKMEKQALAEKQEAKGEARTRELRYFVNKSAYLGQMQASVVGWWAGPWGSYWNSFLS